MIKLDCESSVAYDSPDNIEPFGTRRDNTRNIVFNKKLYKLYGEHNWIKVLDLGCSGGGFVKDCIDDGHLAIGLDGSDFSKKHKRAEWRTIPESLFTCDITKDFKLFKDDEELKFNAITMWDVIEHIEKKDLMKVAENVKKHLTEDGVFILAVGCVEDVINGVRLHQTVENKEWWMKEFERWGFIVVEDYNEYFRNQWVKGKYKYDSGFNVVLTLPRNRPPRVPKQSVKEIVFDVWADSKPQTALRRIVGGYMK